MKRFHTVLFIRPTLDTQEDAPRIARFRVQIMDGVFVLANAKLSSRPNRSARFAGTFSGEPFKLGARCNQATFRRSYIETVSLQKNLFKRLSSSESLWKFLERLSFHFRFVQSDYLCLVSILEITASRRCFESVRPGSGIFAFLDFGFHLNFEWRRLNRWHRNVAKKMCN